MAEVTKHGSHKEGTCGACSCEFVADAKEIKVREEAIERPDDIGEWRSWGTRRNHFIKCPECHKEVILWQD